MTKEEIEEKQKEQNVAPLVRQMILRSLGAYGSTYMGNDIYYLIRAVYMLNAQLDQEQIKIYWEKKGYNYEHTMRLLEKLDKKSAEVKCFYDALEDKKFENKTKDIRIKRFYIKSASKIPALNQELYTFFVFLVNSSTLKHMQINNEYFKILEHQQFRKITMPLGSNMNQDMTYPTQTFIQEVNKGG